MYQKIKEWLTSHAIDFKEVHHQETKTSEESAKARGEDLSTGGKALLLKVDDSFKLFVMSASKKLDSSAVKNHFAAKNLRFADKEELMRVTGLVPGSVPPFGKPIIDVELYVDDSIVHNEKIAFNAGSLTDSIIILVKDYLKISQPQIMRFSKDLTEDT